jgi:hypothetical protein
MSQSKHVKASADHKLALADPRGACVEAGLLCSDVRVPF